MARKWTFLLAGTAGLLLAAPVSAYEPIVSAQGWYRVAQFDDGVCSGEVGTNGQYFVIGVNGLEPGERGRLYLTNGDMKPLNRPMRADSSGAWTDYYFPFRLNQNEGGTVNVQVSGARCNVTLTFDWDRTRGWEEPPLFGAD